MSVSNEIVAYFVALASGAGLGALYFGSLWWTVRRLPSAKRPLRLYFAGLLLRFIVLLGSFLAILRLLGPGPLVAAVAGVLITRIVMTRMVGCLPQPDSRLNRVMS